MLQADTVVPEPGNPQSLNRYSYVLNNPLRYTDPTGNFPDIVCDYAPQTIGCNGGGTTLPPLDYISSQNLQVNWGQEAYNAWCTGLYACNANGGGISDGIAIAGIVWESFPMTIDAYLSYARSPRGVGSAVGASEYSVGEASPANVVGRTARGQAAMGRDFLRGKMRPAERAAYDANPAQGSRFLGQAEHRATAQALESQFPGRYQFSTRGVDFYDTWTGQRIELTTPGQVLNHIMRGGEYNNAAIVTYELPKW